MRRGTVVVVRSSPRWRTDLTSLSQKWPRDVDRKRDLTRGFLRICETPRTDYCSKENDFLFIFVIVEKSPTGSGSPSRFKKIYLDGRGWGCGRSPPETFLKNSGSPGERIHRRIKGISKIVWESHRNKETRGDHQTFEELLIVKQTDQRLSIVTRTVFPPWLIGVQFLIVTDQGDCTLDTIFDLVRNLQ